MRTLVIENTQMPDSIYQRTKHEYIKYLGDILYINDIAEALPTIMRQGVELVILDVIYLGIYAIQLGDLIQANKDVSIVYITDMENCKAVLEAVRLQHAAYIIAPYTTQDFEYALETARLHQHNQSKRIIARTFGNFELFVDGNPVHFKTSKARELLALLIDRRGGIVTSEEAISILWEYRANNDASRSLYSKVGKSLTNTLEEVNASDLVVTARGMKSVNLDRFDCDLYKLLDGDETVKNSYFGRYMNEYSWAEYRVPKLDALCKESE